MIIILAFWGRAAFKYKDTYMTHAYVCIYIYFFTYFFPLYFFSHWNLLLVSIIGRPQNIRTHIYVFPLFLLSYPCWFLCLSHLQHNPYSLDFFWIFYLSAKLPVTTDDVRYITNIRYTLYVIRTIYKSCFSNLMINYSCEANCTNSFRKKNC